MKGTAFVFAAYDSGMETLILLFLLISLDKDPALKDSLRNFLGFYRENRELISAVLKTSPEGLAAEPGGAPSMQSAKQPSAPPAAEKKSRPEQDGSLRILEEYLKRCEF